MSQATKAVTVSALALALAGSLAAAHQSTGAPLQAGGAISGIVIDSVTQKPIAGAVVQISGSPTTPAGATPPPPGGVSMSTGASGVTTIIEPPPEPFRPQRQLTDEQGRFVFINLPGNTSYSVTSTRPGYFDGAYGRRAAAATARRITLVDGQWFRDARIDMTRPSAITGRVVDESGDPVVGVVVKSFTEIFVGGTKQIAAGPVALTDDRGIYRIANLTPARYLIAVPSVQHAVPAAMTAAELAGQSAQVAAAQEPPARRDPSFPAGGSFRTVMAQYAPPPPPSSGGTPQIYPMTFHPAARSAADAATVDLQPGEDRLGVDVQLRPAAAFRITGRLDGPPDAVVGLSLRLLGSGLEGLGRGSETGTALVAADGTFTFLNVPNGLYTIFGSRSIIEYNFRPSGATATLDASNAPGVRFTSMSTNIVEAGPAGTILTRYTYQGNQRYQARQTVTVSGRDITDLVVPMQAGISVRGEVVIESNAPPSVRAQMFVTLRAEPANGDTSLGQPSFIRGSGRGAPGAPGENEFLLEGLLPGAYFLRGPTTIKSIVWNGRDYTDLPFDTTAGRDISGVVITLTDKQTTLSGTIRDRTGQPAANTAVIAFPADRTKWTNYGIQPARIRTNTGSTRGTYTLHGLPAGDYLIVAVDDDSVTRWKDPAFLEAASRTATRFTIGWGDTQTLDLVLQEIR